MNGLWLLIGITVTLLVAGLAALVAWLIRAVF